MGSADLNFAFLNLRGQPRGREMLRHLLRAGFAPTLIIEEESAMAERARAFFVRELPAENHPPELEEILCGRAIPYVEVSNHNDEECERRLRELNVELVVLGDTRIIGPKVMRVPRGGIINTHPGWLPDVRGNNPYVWAILHDLPLGCSCHFIDEGIDTGPIILRRELRAHPGLTFGQLLAELNRLCGELIARVLRDYTRGPLDGRAQGGGPFPTFTKATPDVLAAAKAKLAAGAYRGALWPLQP